MPGKPTYRSGTAVNISCSSLSSSSSDFACASSAAVGGGSHEAINLWDLASATAARLKMMSASEGGSGITVVELRKLFESRVQT